METAPSPRHKMLRLPRHRERPHHKVLRLPRKNGALVFTRFQSIVPVTQNTKMTSHFVTWKRQNEHFVRDFLHFSHFEGKDCVAVRMYRPMAANTTTRRRQHSKTTRTQVQPQTPTINGNPSLRIRESKSSFPTKTPFPPLSH